VYDCLGQLAHIFHKESREEQQRCRQSSQYIKLSQFGMRHLHSITASGNHPFHPSLCL
jgi:hypothetical protein